MVKHNARSSGLLSLSVLLLAGLAALPARADYEAVTTARHDLGLGFSAAGKVTKVHVEPGDRVTAGQVLLELDHREGQAIADLWRQRAQSEVAIHIAEARVKLAAVEERQRRQLREQDVASPIELERAVVQLELEKLGVEQAKQEHVEAQHQYEQAAARVDSFLLRAPRDGVIDTLDIAEGETIEEIKPLVRLVVTERLRLDVMVPTSETLKMRVGDPAWVRPNIEGYDTPVQGEIIHLAQVADARSSTRLVRVEIPNPRELPAGLHVMVRFSAPEGLAQGPQQEDEGR